jgi:hypothetical protein
MSFRDVIRKRIIEPALQERALPQLSGTIIAYDATTNTATVEVDGLGSSPTQFHGVPIPIGAPGLHSGGPFPGDRVRVGFLNNQQVNPTVIAFIDPLYALNTRKRFESHNHGGQVPDSMTRR